MSEYIVSKWGWMRYTEKNWPNNDTIDDIPGSDDTCVECVVAHKHQI